GVWRMRPRRMTSSAIASWSLRNTVATSGLIKSRTFTSPSLPGPRPTRGPRPAGGLAPFGAGRILARAVKEELDDRLAFLGLGDADRRLLGDLAPLLERHADRFVTSFYRHLLSFDETRRLLSDPAVTERLLRKQRNYLLSLACPSLDEKYLEERIRIGAVHAKVGLGPRYYLGAYALYFSLLAPVIAAECRGDAERIQQTLAALVKVLLLDAEL